jgi:hypothetical protein
LDTITFLAEHSTAVWALVSGLLSGMGGLLIRVRGINASVERTRLKAASDAAAAEQAERAAFRATLLTEITAMRQLIKECEIDRDALRERLASAEAQILVLKASNEIMEKWVTFFRDGVSPQAAAIVGTVRRAPVAQESQLS